VASLGPVWHHPGSGGAWTSRQPGHFQVTKVVRQVIRYKRQQHSKGARSFRGQKILNPGHRMHFFPQKSWRPFLVVAHQNTGRQAADCFTVKIKQIKRSDMLTFSFSVHSITEAKQIFQPGYQPGAVYLPWFIQVLWPGAPWCSGDTASRGGGATPQWKCKKFLRMNL